MKVKEQITRHKMFLPVLLTWVGFMLSLGSLNILMKSLPTTTAGLPVWSCFGCNVGIVGIGFKAELLFLFPTIIAVLLVQVFVISISVVTVKNRRTWDTKSIYNVTVTRYLSVSLCFAILTFVGYWIILGSQFSTFNPLLVLIEDKRNYLFCAVEIVKLLLEAMAVVTIILLFCAVYSLVPTLVWDGQEEDFCSAKEQLSYLAKWLKYYIDITIIYFLVGGAFQFAYVDWLASNISSERDSLTEIGIVFFNASFYMFLLVMVFLPSGIRIQKAILYVEIRETQKMTVPQRSQWRLDNGFPDFDFVSSVKYLAALLSPLVFPVLSLIVE